MRIHIIQPHYPENLSSEQVQKTIDLMLSQLPDPRGGVDIVLFPEYANCPGCDQDPQLLDNWLSEHPPERFLETISRQARDKKFAIAVNVLTVEASQRFNRTVLLDRNGQSIHHYDKCHLTKSESDALGVTPGQMPTLVTFEDVKISFATCFDIYFPAFFERLADLRPDLILFPSYQRSERSEVIRTQCRARALDTGAYIARASYSMGSKSRTGGTSLLASPEGELLLDAGQKVGGFTVEIDPQKKYVRPLHHGGELLPARQIVDIHSQPCDRQPND